MWWNSKVISLKISFHGLSSSGSFQTHLSQFQRSRETEELLKGVDEKQNVPTLPMQHTTGVTSVALCFWWHNGPALLTAAARCQSCRGTTSLQWDTKAQTLLLWETLTALPRSPGFEYHEKQLAAFLYNPNIQGYQLLISICQRHPLHYLGKTLEMPR